MVGLVRFEPTQTPLQVTDAKAHRKRIHMLHTSKSTTNPGAPAVDLNDLTKKLTEAETNRRELLAQLIDQVCRRDDSFLLYVRSLLKEARPETVVRLQELVTSQEVRHAIA